MRWKIACVALLVGGCAAGVAGRQEHRDEFARVAQLEDARWDGDGELERLSEHADARVRERAATALGRLPFPEEGAHVTRALLARLFDEEAGVRATAAFALGMRGDASAGDKLVYVALDYHQSDADPLVRARAIEALSKLDRPEFHERLLDALADPDPRVRLEAVQGASRWSTTAENAGAINTSLVAHLARESDETVATYTLFALERRKAKEAGDAFLRYSSSSVVEQRLYAVRGLKALADLSPRILEGETDARILAEAATALATRGDAPGLLTAAKLCSHDSASVRRSAWEALGAALQRNASVYTNLQKLGVEARQLGSSFVAEESAWVRGAMFEAHLRSLTHGDATEGAANDTLTMLGSLYSRLATQERIGVVRGVAALEGGHAVPILLEFAKDPELVVGEAAIELLANRADPMVRTALRQWLAVGDNGVRLATVMALRGKLEAGDDERLVQCFESTHGDGTPEVRCQVLEVLGESGGEHAKSLAARAMFDEHPFVRRTARKVFAALAGDSAETQRALDASLAHRSEAEVDRRTQRIDVREHRSNPHAEVVTSRGSMVFELFPREAPLHVENFLALVEGDYYDGLTFHRVVPDFVIQGGCYRGDGNGGGTWRGREDALRHEITPRKYVRGSLGMPRWDDVDSGGSQFFVTHRSTPHLDGRYTIFGELREGFEVLDAIEVGDTIVDVVVVNR